MAATPTQSEADLLHEPDFKFRPEFGLMVNIKDSRRRVNEIFCFDFFATGFTVKLCEFLAKFKEKFAFFKGNPVKIVIPLY